MHRTFVIAEAGVNHNGSLERALELVDGAADAGADAVKFQTFRANRVASTSAPKAAYQDRAVGSADAQVDMLRKLELTPSAHATLQERCVLRGIEFLSTPFDQDSLTLLLGMGVKRIKISSGDVNNLTLLRAIGRSGKPAILSTGMCLLGDIEAALGGLASGYLGPENTLPLVAFRSKEGQDALKENVSILHCTTEYPAPVDEVNLLAIRTLAQSFGLPVGYSDHTEGIDVSVAAVAVGATIIEKHFTTDRSLPGPDHRASLELRELAALVKAIRIVERALGDGRKIPTASEMANVPAARRSLVAAKPIRAGERFSDENLTAKRPGIGISPMRLDEIVGTQARRDYAADELID